MSSATWLHNKAFLILVITRQLSFLSCWSTAKPHLVLEGEMQPFVLCPLWRARNTNAQGNSELYPASWLPHCHLPGHVVPQGQPFALNTKAKKSKGKEFTCNTPEFRRHKGQVEQNHLNLLLQSFTSHSVISSSVFPCAQVRSASLCPLTAAAGKHHVTGNSASSLTLYSAFTEVLAPLLYRTSAQHVEQGEEALSSSSEDISAS